MEYEGWIVAEKPGYQGKRKDADIARWNTQYGEGNWKLAWQALGEIWRYEDVFWKVYVAGYARYFRNHPREADELVYNYGYAYDKDWVTREQAFDPHYLYEKPGAPNQFHHVALNIALEYFVGKEFCGISPIQVREGKPGTDPASWPAGWRWSPGRIPLVNKSLTPTEGEIGWWQKASSEDFYQRNKVLLIRSN